MRVVTKVNLIIFLSNPISCQIIFISISKVYKIDHARKKIYDVRESTKFCQLACLKNSKLYTSTLSTTPVYLRSNAPPDVEELLRAERERKGTKLSRLDKVMRGAGNSEEPPPSSCNSSSFSADRGLRRMEEDLRALSLTSGPSMSASTSIDSKQNSSLVSLNSLPSLPPSHDLAPKVIYSIVKKSEKNPSPRQFMNSHEEEEKYAEAVGHDDGLIKSHEKGDNKNDEGIINLTEQVAQTVTMGNIVEEDDDRPMEEHLHFPSAGSSSAIEGYTRKHKAAEQSSSHHMFAVVDNLQSVMKVESNNPLQVLHVKNQASGDNRGGVGPIKSTLAGREQSRKRETRVKFRENTEQANAAMTKENEVFETIADAILTWMAGDTTRVLEEWGRQDTNGAITSLVETTCSRQKLGTMSENVEIDGDATGFAWTEMQHRQKIMRQMLSENLNMIYKQVEIGLEIRVAEEVWKANASYFRHVTSDRLIDK